MNSSGFQSTVLSTSKKNNQHKIIICHRGELCMGNVWAFPSSFVLCWRRISPLMKRSNLHRHCLQEVLRLHINLLFFTASFKRQTIEDNTSGLLDFLEHPFFCSNIRDESIPNTVFPPPPLLWQPFLYSAFEDHQVLIYGQNDPLFLPLPVLLSNPLSTAETLVAHLQLAHALFLDLASVGSYRSAYRGECGPSKSLTKKASGNASGENFCLRRNWHQRTAEALSIPTWFSLLIPSHGGQHIANIYLYLFWRNGMKTELGRKPSSSQSSFHSIYSAYISWQSISVLQHYRKNVYSKISFLPEV